ncbi:D-aspartate oxidase-like [Uloborus diversus]|uniref:D-aspartate oxidase-like n=1 Tax=Uloborus diversus TaxID=327109 RepID=UPI00240989F9|nr:D-aspartate oxidase-like [Uloborus diversus]
MIEEAMNKNFAVIGAGVVGLSTALSIQKEFPSSSITVFADKFNNDTLSSGAGGIFRPELNIEFDSERLRKWCEDSYNHFVELLKSTESSESGMLLLSGYQLSTSSRQIENPFLQSLLPSYRKVTEKELETFPPKFKHGVFFTTPVVDCRFYLPWMKSKLESSGGKIVKKHISSLAEIPDQYDVIINCAGLGAKGLTHDDMLVPIRGQTIKVKAPWIKHFYYGDEVYVIPGVEYVTLGGIKDFGSWNMNVNTYQKQFIWDKCTELIPSLKKAEVLWDWVGLRPFRSQVRVDGCFVKSNRKYKLVVNNYGHGGHGVALSWGTAQEATRIVKKLLLSKSITASKL